MEEKEDGTWTIIGDFNVRTGGKGGRIGLNEEEEEGGRNSRDRKVNKGRKLIESIKERGWFILNGGVEVYRGTGHI